MKNDFLSYQNIIKRPGETKGNFLKKLMYGDLFTSKKKAGQRNSVSGVIRYQVGR